MHTICLTCTVTMVTKQFMPVLLVDSAWSTYTVETLHVCIKAMATFHARSCKMKLITIAIILLCNVVN